MERDLRRLLRGGAFGELSKVRSDAMRAIRSKGNKATEGTLRMALIRAGLKGWKLNSKELPGCPDFYFPKKKAAIFVDGCFWHGCPTCGHVPKVRRLFWAAKINKNKERDKKTSRLLKGRSLKVIRVWEHSLKTNIAVAQVIKRIKTAILK